MRVNIQLACTECKRRNYSTEKKQEEYYGSSRGKQVLSLR
jgi:Ribosomal protein L33.